MERSIKMVRRVGGVMGELGRGLRFIEGGHLSVDVLSIGPQFQELDHRWLEADMRKPAFCRYAPSTAILH
jgi:hypothetical protein